METGKPTNSPILPTSKTKTVATVDTKAMADKVLAPASTPAVQVEAKKEPTPEPTQVIPEPIPEPKVPERKFQHYKCSRRSMKMITKKGRLIIFINFKFITDDVEYIEYLDTEIASGLRDVTKGALMTSEEADPMTALRRKFFAEFAAEEAEKVRAKALGEFPEMGRTKEPGKAALNPTSTRSAGGLAVGSSSSDAVG